MARLAAPLPIMSLCPRHGELLGLQIIRTFDNLTITMYFADTNGFNSSIINPKNVFTYGSRAMRQLLI